MRHDDVYTYFYEHDLKCNGKHPDEFILNKLNNEFPDSKNIDVLDIGAGDGRNSIPIAQKGYNVVAYDLSSAGVDLINELFGKFKFKNCHAKKKDILNGSTLPEGKFEFVFMSHISQHFSLTELKTVFANISKSMENKGVFVFDALINKNRKRYKENIEAQEDGYVQFNMRDIKRAARKKGFKVKEIENYSEDPKKRVRYIDNPCWNETCQLKWFVLTKK